MVNSPGLYGKKWSFPARCLGP